jgi:Na+-driven multidrug efflux pump
LGLFTGDPAVVNRGMEILQVIVPGYGAYICIEILGGALKGLGNSFMPMVITGIGISLTRIVWLFLAEPVWTDIRIVALSYPLSWLITSVFYMFYYRLYRKMKKY